MRLFDLILFQLFRFIEFLGVEKIELNIFGVFGGEERSILSHPAGSVKEYSAQNYNFFFIFHFFPLSFLLFFQFFFHLNFSHFFYLFTRRFGAPQPRRPFAVPSVPIW